MTLCVFLHSETQYLSYLQRFQGLGQDINLPLRQDKTVQPSQEVVLHGLSSTLCQKLFLSMRINATRLLLLRGLQHQRKTTFHELQSGIGLLSFACHASESGQCFLRRLIDLTIVVSHPHHNIRITREARHDICAWLLFLEGFSGTLYFRHPQWSSSHTIRLFTNASDLGFSLVHSDTCTYGTWLDLSPSYIPYQYLRNVPVGPRLDTLWGYVTQSLHYFHD